MKTSEAVTILRRLQGTVKLPEEHEALGHAVAIMSRLTETHDLHAPAGILAVSVQTPPQKIDKIAGGPLRYTENY